MNHPSQILQRYGLEPKKSLGQNFLFDDNVLGRIVAAADVQPADVVLEIGPGLGHLTRLLAATSRQVVAVELDDRLIPVLQERLADLDNVQLIHGDILAQNPSELFATPYKVAANVPYYITGAILRHLLDAPHKPTQMVMTVQKEVAERVTAVPPNMSLLSVTVQFYAQATMAGVIKAGAFYPRPDVDSAILALDLTKAPQLDISPNEVTRFFRLVKIGFSQKRKQLQKNLRQLGMGKKIVAQGLALAGIDGRARAETLSLEQWAALYKQLYHVPKIKSDCQ